MKLLEMLCEKIDGICTFVLLLNILLVDFALSKNSNQSIDDYEKLSALKGSKFAKTTNKEVILDVSLLVLTALSYQLVLREAFFTMMKEILKGYTEVLTISSTPLIKCRVILLSGYIFESLFDEEDNKPTHELGFQYLRFICTNLQKVNGEDYSDVISSHSTTSLKMLFNSKPAIEVIKQVQNEVLGNLVGSITTIQNEDFFEILRFILA